MYYNKHRGRHMSRGVSDRREKGRATERGQREEQLMAVLMDGAC